VAIPMAFDQPGVAARIAHHRTGVVTSLDKLTADHLSELLNEVLNNSTYRNNAQRNATGDCRGKRIVRCRGYHRTVLRSEQKFAAVADSSRDSHLSGRTEVKGTNSAIHWVESEDTVLAP